MWESACESTGHGAVRSRRKKHSQVCIHAAYKEERRRYNSLV